jgi:hypothetical protein
MTATLKARAMSLSDPQWQTIIGVIARCPAPVREDVLKRLRAALPAKGRVTDAALLDLINSVLTAKEYWLVDDQGELFNWPPPQPKQYTAEEEAAHRAMTPTQKAAAYKAFLHTPVHFEITGSAEDLERYHAKYRFTSRPASRPIPASPRAAQRIERQASPVSGPDLVTEQKGRAPKS